MHKYKHLSGIGGVGCGRRTVPEKIEQEKYLHKTIIIMYRYTLWCM